MDARIKSGHDEELLWNRCAAWSLSSHHFRRDPHRGSSLAGAAVRL